jgi:hypothetical protein
MTYLQILPGLKYDKSIFARRYGGRNILLLDLCLECDGIKHKVVARGGSMDINLRMETEITDFTEELTKMKTYLNNLYFTLLLHNFADNISRRLGIRSIKFLFLSTIMHGVHKQNVNYVFKNRE